MRKFSTGAIRDDDESKVNYEKGLSPLVLEAYGLFMRKHNAQVDGGHRDEGNWKKGFTKQSYMESKWRHFMATYLIHDEFVNLEIRNELIDGLNREPTVDEIEIKRLEMLLESLCAELFNTMGYMHVVCLEQREIKTKKKCSAVQALINVIKAYGLKAKDVVYMLNTNKKDTK